MIDNLRKLFELTNEYPWTAIITVVAIISLIQALRGKCL